MYLDLRSMQVAAIVVCCVLGPLSLAFTPNQRYMQPSRFWGAGLIALAGALALVILGALAVAVSKPAAMPGVADAVLLVGMIAGLLLGTMLLLWVMTERINSGMRRLVAVDPLTGALNRLAFVEQFEREASRTRRMSDAQFAVLLIDIDHFRRVNDRDTMLRAADAALLYAKKLGGNGVEAAVAMPRSSGAAFDAPAAKAGADQGPAPQPRQPH